MISETKTDDSFPIGNFFIDRFSTPFRSYCDANGGEVILCVWKDIFAIFLATEMAPLEGLYVELNLDMLNGC